MSKHGARLGTVHICGGSPEATRVELDGEDISQTLTGLSVRLDAGELPCIQLDVLVLDLTAELENPRIVIPDDTRDLLIRFGWTPPSDDPEEGLNELD